MTEKPPAFVLALSERVGKEPMEWKEFPDRVVIIFTTGQKMVFDRLELSPTMSEYLSSERSEGDDLTPGKKNAVPPAIKSHAARPGTVGGKKK